MRDRASAAEAELQHLIWLPDGHSLSLLTSKQLPGATVDGLRDLAESIATTLRPVAVTAAPSANPQGVGVPDGWPIDLTLPPGWRWTWDAASYQAMLDGLDATRRAAAEQVGPPSAETWTYPYAVDTTSAPLPGGGLTMLMLFTTGADQTPTIELLEAARRTNVGQGLTLIGVERLELPGGPLVRNVYRAQRQAGDPATEVGLVGYETIVANDLYGSNDLYGFSFIIPEQELGSGIDALDAVMATLRIHPPAPTPAPAPTPTLRPADVHVLVDPGVLTMKPAKVHAGSTVFEVDARAHTGYANGPMFFGPITDAQLKLLRSGDADWRGQYFHTDPGTTGEHWDLNPGIQQPSAVVVRPGRYVLLTVDAAGKIDAYALLTVVP